jgi:hypothetical protein
MVNTSRLMIDPMTGNWVRLTIGLLGSTSFYPKLNLCLILAAAFTFSKRAGVRLVHVVDPSARARDLAAKYGVGYSESVDHAPVVDLVYSAHSIEHVADLLDSIGRLLSKVRGGGFVFFETPNIGDQQIFETLCHTPHTFMLSANSFILLESRFPVKIIGLECCGPAWQSGRKQIKSSMKADLRVLLQKMSNT